MQGYELKSKLRLTVKDELGGTHYVDFAEAELTVKTWKSAPYGYGRDQWEPETLIVWIHEATGALTVDPDAYVGESRVVEREHING